MKRKENAKKEWNGNLAYTVGIIATDGNLSPDGRHINITSKDKEIVRNIRTCLGLKNKIGGKGNGVNPEKKYHVLQFGDKSFYDYLLNIGLTPAKSKSIGILQIPQMFFRDFLRGCIDGDGNIQVSSHPESNLPQLRISICSASKKFLLWIKNEIKSNLKINNGWVYSSPKKIHALCYGKKDSIKIIKYVYYGGKMNERFTLKRKFKIAQKFI